MGVIRTIANQPALVGQGVKFLKEHGVRETYRMMTSVVSKDTSYLPDKSQRRKYKGNIKFSILMPVYNVDVNWLQVAIDSVKAQNYTNWELCIVCLLYTSPSPRDRG
mgnify:CR=1 FL=1